MPEAIYRFSRGSDTKEGKLSAFFSKNYASTDALNALGKWCSDAPNRRHETVRESDEELIAALTWGDSDGRAGQSLEVECERVGILRDFIKQNQGKI